ncbi:MAG: collagen-like protein [Porphyromonas sp.]|uniref:collagen-like protein n=1 Tax=Porphyromonas sp. TaxID=1924944 RepID=UPI002A764F22|nr:collagen-like protein [Porphyromonas sp.]MDY3112086.1 collagen-like protein [Porphyromonas sp.]MDY4245966.1 collagen-like protein [Porphyromonas sp.]
MLYLRPQRVYKPSALSYLGDPSDIVDSIIDRYLNKDLYRLRIETPRGTSITEDNSQITCYAHIFDKEDGSELTDLLKGRGFRPTWLLDGKPIDSTRISEEGYQITLETDHLPAIYQTVTLQARDTDILLALTTDEIQKRIYSQLIELGSIPTHLIKTSEKLLDIHYLDKLRIDGIEIVKQELSKEIAANTTALSELHKHPLTISEEGYWRIWDIKQHQYVTTEYQSRGEKGEPGDKGDKGDKPVLTLDSQLRLLADGQLLSPQSLKGAKGDRGETGARGATGAKGDKGADGHSPSPEEVIGTPRFTELLASELTSSVEPVTNDLAVANKYLDNAFAYIENIVREIDSSRSYTISDSGYISSSVHNSCRSVSKEVTPYSSVCSIPNKQPQIRLTLRSDHDALKRQVDSLSARLAQLEATTKITPVTNADLRKRGSTLYPQYGDWLLTSDASDQYISFSGLSAEIGRSIYIQTRRKAYLYANNHSFYGLPGSSTSVSQWLSNNTTYRFVRCSSDSWLVTASSSPYPWT